MRNRRLPVLLLLTLTWTTTTTTPSAVASPRPQVEGQPPPALAPDAENDPISKLKLQPHAQQTSARMAAESFLAHLSQGYELANLGDAGGSVGDSQGYAKAWALMGPGRPTLSEFRRRWANTARLGVIQLEPKGEGSFFVELERVEWCGDHWAVSYYVGELTTVRTPAGWRVADLRVEPEHLVAHNIGGHQGWQHDAEFMAVWLAHRQLGDGWTLEKLRNERRMATGWLRQKGEVWRVYMARTVEGDWILLRIAHE